MIMQLDKKYQAYFRCFSLCLSPLSLVWHRKCHQLGFSGTDNGCYGKWALYSLKKRSLDRLNQIWPRRQWGYI